MFLSNLTLLSLLLCAHLVFGAWLPSDYPNPETLGENDPTCRTNSNVFCDPNGVLDTDDEMAQISQALNVIRRSPNLCDDSEDKEASIEIQFAMALAKKMDLSKFDSSNDVQNRGAEVFARHVHDDWGVGMVTNCGGTGVLIFLSLDDRVVYLSRGKALERVLTNSRLDKIIEHMKPLLRKRQTKDALMLAINELDARIESGEPQFWERMEDIVAACFGPICFAAMALFMGWSMRRQNLERQRYAQVASQLNEIDQARAEALQGQYKVASCPICFEPFSKTEGEENFSTGSDGKPIKLLRCGHVFCATCWDEWVSTGRGQVDKCPICKQDIGPSTAAPPQDETNQQLAQRQRQQQQRALRQYNYERQFRLMRLGTRFPQYINSQQIQRWTDSTYNGQLARDPSFTRNNPSVRSGGASRGNYHGNRSGGGSSGFGGGSSGGGRGGRW